MATDDHTQHDIADLTELWSVAAQAYMDGDLPHYAALANHASDFTLTPPYGGDPRRGFDGSDPAIERTANTFRGGAVDLEVHASYASGGLAVLVAVERQHGTVGDLPSQEWSLRITLVFRRDGESWQLVHRHADPLTAPSPTSTSPRSREESTPRTEISISPNRVPGADLPQTSAPGARAHYALRTRPRPALVLEGPCPSGDASVCSLLPSC